jgi:O-antigen/teichoic acid export membrane protein
MSTSHKLIAPGLLLFIDSLLVAAGNWIFWLVISKFTLVSEVGQATTIYSLVALIATSIQLGLEYPLLKQAYTQKSQILATALAVELILSIATLPILLYTITFFDKSAQDFLWLAIGLLFSSAIGFVTRYILLGISDVRSVLLIDVVGNCLKFVMGYALVLGGNGASAILMSFLSYNAFVAGTSLVILLRRIGFELKRSQIKFAIELTKAGLINTPFKLSKVFIITLSIILLTPFGISNADIGIFYISLMISVIAGSLASSIAFMVIPASTKIGNDLSSIGIRIGLSLTAPIISALLVAPKFILSTIGTQYVTGDMVLLILAVSIFPNSIAFNAISAFNNNGEYRKIIIIGSIEFLTFFTAFWFLVPIGGITGAAVSVLLAFVAACIPSIIWLKGTLSRYVSTSIAAIIVGVTLSYILGLVTGMHPLVLIIVSFVVTSIIIITLKNIRLVEIKEIVGVVTKTKEL